MIGSFVEANYQCLLFAKRGCSQVAGGSENRRKYFIHVCVTQIKVQNDLAFGGMHLLYLCEKCQSRIPPKRLLFRV